MYASFTLFEKCLIDSYALIYFQRLRVVGLSAYDYNSCVTSATGHRTK